MQNQLWRWEDARTWIEENQCLVTESTHTSSCTPIDPGTCLTTEGISSQECLCVFPGSLASPSLRVGFKSSQSWISEVLRRKDQGIRESLQGSWVVMVSQCSASNVESPHSYGKREIYLLQILFLIFWNTWQEQLKWVTIYLGSEFRETHSSIPGTRTGPDLGLWHWPGVEKSQYLPADFLPIPVVLSLSPQTMRWDHPRSGWIVQPQWHLSGNSLRDPFVGDVCDGWYLKCFLT